jgi:hypothetical protein
MTNEVIGLNLHDCIRDIVLGTVPIANVRKIITGHACRNEFDWEATIVSGLKYFWTDLNQDKVRLIIQELRSDNKIKQPLLNNSNRFPVVFHNGTRTVWVDDENKIVWSDAKTKIL